MVTINMLSVLRWVLFVLGLSFIVASGAVFTRREEDVEYGSFIVPFTLGLILVLAWRYL